MNDKQNEKLNMYQTVLKYCRENSDAYTDTPVVARYTDELENCINQIKHTAANQSSIAIKGATAHKSNAVNALVNTCLAVSGPLYAYAFDNKNEELMDQSSMNKNVLYRAHGNQTLTNAKNISILASNHVAVLQGYGVTEEDIKALDDAIDEYEALIVSPRTALNKRKQYTGNLVQLIAATSSLLCDRMDKVMIRFSTTDPEFYKGYKNARSINSMYARKRSNEEETVHNA